MAYGNGGAAVGMGGLDSAKMGGQAIQEGGIFNELDAHLKRANILHDTITQLYERLSTFLAPEPPSSSASAPHVNPVQVLDRMRDTSAAISGANQRLTDLLNRLQL